MAGAYSLGRWTESLGTAGSLHGDASSALSQLIYADDTCLIDALAAHCVPPHREISTKLKAMIVSIVPAPA